MNKKIFIIFEYLIIFTLCWLQIYLNDTEEKLASIVILLLIIFSFVSIFHLYGQLKDKIAKILKVILLSTFIFIFSVWPIVSEIYQRYSAPNSYNILNAHDGSLQTEEAIKYLLEGKNPFKENYFGTPLERWNYWPIQGYENPALYHYAYFPFLIITSVPFYIFSNSLTGMFDERIVFLLAFIGVLLLLFKLIKGYENRVLFFSIFGLTPAFTYYFIWGSNDIFVFLWLLISILFFLNKKILWGMIFLGISAASKQYILFFLPFLVFYLLQNNYSLKSFINVFKKFIPFIIVFLAIILPFLLWDAKAFYDSTFGYFTGTAPNPYVMRGVGLSTWIKDYLPWTAYFPFWIFQIAFGFIALWISFKIQNKNNNLASAIFGYLLFLFIYMFFARYFYQSHIFIIIWLILLMFASHKFFGQKINFKSNIITKENE